MIDPKIHITQTQNSWSHKGLYNNNWKEYESIPLEDLILFFPPLRELLLTES